MVGDVYQRDPYVAREDRMKTNKATMPRGMGRTYTWIPYDDPSNTWFSWWDNNSQTFKNVWEDGGRPETSSPPCLPQRVP